MPSAPRSVPLAARLDELREGWLDPPDLSGAELVRRTLTNLYNARPTRLANAHVTLDAAVLDAYGWPADLPDAEILARLLALNLERAAATPGAPGPRATDAVAAEPPAAEPQPSSLPSSPWPPRTPHRTTDGPVAPGSSASDRR